MNIPPSVQLKSFTLESDLVLRRVQSEKTQQSFEETKIGMRLHKLLEDRSAVMRKSAKHQQFSARTMKLRSLSTSSSSSPLPSAKTTRNIMMTTKQPSEDIEEEEDFGDFDAPTPTPVKNETEDEEDFGDFDAPTPVKTETSVFDTIEGSNSVLEPTVVKENKPVVESDPWGDLFGSPAADTTTERTKSTRSTSNDFSFDPKLSLNYQPICLV